MCRQSHLLETWCMMDYAERGSLADSLRGGKLRRADGAPDLAAIVQCLQDIANGVRSSHVIIAMLGFPSPCRATYLAAPVEMGS